MIGKHRFIFSSLDILYGDLGALRRTFSKFAGPPANFGKPGTYLFEICNNRIINLLMTFSRPWRTVYLMRKTRSLLVILLSFLVTQENLLSRRCNDWQAPSCIKSVFIIKLNQSQAMVFMSALAWRAHARPDLDGHHDRREARQASYGGNQGWRGQEEKEAKIRGQNGRSMTYESSPDWWDNTTSHYIGHISGPSPPFYIQGGRRRGRGGKGGKGEEQKGLKGRMDTLWLTRAAPTGEIIRRSITSITSPTRHPRFTFTLTGPWITRVRILAEIGRGSIKHVTPVLHRERFN